MRAPRQGERHPTDTTMREEDALRCHCGSLLARVVPGGIEIKCRRCKRRVVIPLGAPDSAENHIDQ
jgi:phage FluMu protein Com